MNINKLNIIIIAILILPTIGMIIYSIISIQKLNFRASTKSLKFNLSKLIKSNSIRKHILKNTAEPYNEEKAFNDFKSFITNSPLYNYIINIKENNNIRKQNEEDK